MSDQPAVTVHKPIFIKAANGPIHAANTLGHTVRIARDQVALVRGDLATACFEAGGIPVSDPASDTPDAVVESTHGPSTETIHTAVKAACVAIMSDGNPELFTVAGQPKVSVVEEMCEDIDPSFIHRALIGDVWDELNNNM